MGSRDFSGQYDYRATPRMEDVAWQNGGGAYLDGVGFNDDKIWPIVGTSAIIIIFYGRIEQSFDKFDLLLAALDGSGDEINQS